MADYVTNIWTIDGPEKSLDEIVGLLLDDERRWVVFDKLIPMPEALAEAKRSEQSDWEFEHWGTNEPCPPSRCDIQTPEDLGFVKLEFDTRWAPAHGVVDEIRRRWPEVDVVVNEITEAGCY